MIDEFDFIKRIQKQLRGASPEGVLSLGDDCSAIPFGDSQAQITTTDCLVENIHFRTTTTSFEDLGRKALAVNLSDIAAMGGRPQWCHLSLAVPQNFSESSAEAFFKGFLSDAKAHEVTLLGGDLSRSPRDIFINVSITGVVEKQKMKTRAGFRPGADLLLVGAHGVSALGLAALESATTTSEILSPYVQKHRRPQALVSEGQWLGEQKAVLGMMDTSDGVLSALQQLTKGFDVGFTVDCNSSWYQNDFAEACKLLKLDPIDLALTGGEDYGLLLALEAGQHENFISQFQKEFQTSILKIGSVETTGIKVTENGTLLDRSHSVFKHF